MKLEFKHLASYLPYRLKYKFESEDFFHEVIGLDITNNPIKLISPFGDFGSCEINVGKPILFPLSSLTKEITVNGKTFVPIDELKNYSDHKVVFECPDYILLKDNYTIEQNVLGAPLAIIEDLYTWKFDVYGLIDKNLAEPVTEDFNPYK